MMKNELSERIESCKAVNKNNERLFKLADSIGHYAKIIAIIMLIAGFIAALMGSVEEYNRIGYYGTYTDERFNFMLFCTKVITYIIYTAVTFGVLTAYSILIRCLGEISQNTANAARLAELQVELTAEKNRSSDTSKLPTLPGTEEAIEIVEEESSN